MLATTEAQGVQVKLTADSTWNGGPMLRTELLPQTTNSLTGNLYANVSSRRSDRFIESIFRYFHVSLQIPTVNTPGKHNLLTCKCPLLTFQRSCL